MMNHNYCVMQNTLQKAMVPYLFIYLFCFHSLVQGLTGIKEIIDVKN